MNKSLLNRTYINHFQQKLITFGVLSSSHNLYIGTESIPTSEKEVRVSDSGLMAHIPSSDAGWLSASNIVGQWPIR